MLLHPLFTAAFLSFIILMFSSFSCFNSPMPFPSIVHYGPHDALAFAYFISGGNRDGDRIFQLPLAVYHPRNRYLLHLGMEARDEERQRLATAAMSVPVICAFGNVDVAEKADYMTYLGSSNAAVTLRAASVMMKLDGGWDWFVTLSARDYPLVTQDDLSHVFSSVQRDLNFIDHTSDLGLKEFPVGHLEPILPGVLHLWLG